MTLTRIREIQLVVVAALNDCNLHYGETRRDETRRGGREEEEEAVVTGPAPIGSSVRRRPLLLPSFLHSTEA